MDNRESLVKLIERFTRGEDVSIAAVNAIEVAVEEMFPNDDEMQDVVVQLASYRPGGGEYLYNEAEIEPALAKILKKLE